MSTKVSSFYKTNKLFSIHIFFDFEDNCEHFEIRTDFFALNIIYWKRLRYITRPDFIARFACKINKHNYLWASPFDFANPKYNCVKCDKELT